MIAEKLFVLFRGLRRAYGSYKIEGKSESGKTQGRAQTVQGEFSIVNWEKHLTGVAGMGVVPIMDDNNCYFAAIDIDVYDLDLNELERKIRQLLIPLVLCRTKSGGAHLYLFLRDPVPAKRVREYMTQWAISLGFPGVEIFPKQDALAGPEDVGNWINMPYFDAERSTRYAIKDGKALTVEEFVEHAEAMRVTSDDLKMVEVHVVDVISKEAPPCLRTLAIHGVPEGTRNNALYNFAVLAKQMRPDDDTWHNLLGEFNSELMNPPLPLCEVNALIKSFTRKEYFYKCNQAPINTCCNKDLCRKAEFGIGRNGADPGVQIDGVTKICTDPPIWIIQVAGSRIQMDTDDFLNQSRFAKKCVEAINFFPLTLKAPKWKQLVNELLSTVREIQAPPDSGAKGLFMYHVEQFCTTRAPARKKDEILLGKPWHEDDRTYFRAADLMKYLEQQRFRDIKGNHVYVVMKQTLKDVDHHFFNLRGKGVNCWSVPSFEFQTEEQEVPTIPEESF